MIHVNQQGDVYEVRFRYDPILVDYVKRIPGRLWNSSAKFWTIPKEHLGFFISQLKGTDYEAFLQIRSDEHLDENATLDATDTIPEYSLANVRMYVGEGMTLYSHQYDFMKYALHRQEVNKKYQGFLLGDEPGLGKTLEVMNLAMYNKEHHNFKHCLVVCCINSCKLNWYEDIKKHTQGEEIPYILGTRLRKRSKREYLSDLSADKVQDLQTGHMYGDLDAPELPYFLIVNIEAFRAKIRKTFTFTEEVIRLINEGQINMIAIDEIHRNASPSSIQGDQLMEVHKHAKCQVMFIPMTGTPIINRPTDVFLPLKLIGGHNFTSYYAWCKQFCVYGGYGNHDIIGYKNIPTLKQMLQTNMLRRLKADTLDLPPLIQFVNYVDNTAHQQQLYDRIVQELKASRDQLVKTLNPLTAFIRLRQVNGSPELIDPSIRIDDDYIKKNAKLQMLFDLLEEIHERHEKVIIFSNWVEPLRTLYKFISKKYKVCCYVGTMSEAARIKHKKVFVENPEYTVMIGTIGTLGVSHTLTVAQNVIFYDEPWTYADKKQAWDRISRIGATAQGNVYTIITRDTVDDKVHDIVYTKKDIATYIVDGKIDIRANPELFDQLLN